MSDDIKARLRLLFSELSLCNSTMDYSSLDLADSSYFQIWKWADVKSEEWQAYIDDR